MARIIVQEAKAWCERTKLPVTALDEDLLAHIEEEVLRQISSAYDTTTWVDQASTPKLVRTIISKMYISWLYDRQYSEDAEANVYAARLQNNADMLIKGIVDGSVVLPDATIPTTAGFASFYPTDISSAQEATADDSSLGPSKFSMGQVF